MAHAADFSPTGLIHEALTSRADRAQEALETRTAHSWKMALDRAEVISGTTGLPGGVGYTLFLREGNGARVVDLDGTSRIDFCMGFGTQLLGHNHAAVQAALLGQIARGWQLGLPTATQLDLARLIQAAAPANERVALCASGNEANLFALRAARAVTGKDGIAVFAGSSHGTHDYALVSGDAGAQDTLGFGHKTHRGAGVPRAIDDVTTVLPYGHPGAFDMIRRQRHDLAAVMVEAVRAADPHLDAGSWLQELEAVCRSVGVVFILDEVTTGFRLAYGGAQEVFGLQPDLVTYGRHLGGGLPLGAVAGRASIMTVFSGTAVAGGICVSSSFAGNPLAVASGFAAIGYASSHAVNLYPGLERATARLARKFNAAAAVLEVPATMRAAGSLFRVFLGPSQPRGGSASPAALHAAEDAFGLLVLNGGILLHPGLGGFLSAAHDDATVDQAIDIFTAALADLKGDGLFARLSAT